MQTVKPIVILDDAAQMMRWDATDLDARAEADRRTAFSLALQEVWEAWWFPVLMQCTQQALAPTFTSGSTTAPAGATVYWPLTGQYYTNLLDTDNTADPTDAAGTTDYSQWARWTADLPTSTVRDATADYAAGDQVLDDDVRYQAAQDVPAGTAITDTAYWLPVPDWTPLLPVNDLAGAPTGPYGSVRSVSRLDPRTTDNPGLFELEETSAGTRVLGLDTGRVWLWTRRPTPVINAQPYDPDATYEATNPEDLVWN